MHAVVGEGAQILGQGDERRDGVGAVVLQARFEPCRLSGAFVEEVREFGQGQRVAPVGAPAERREGEPRLERSEESAAFDRHLQARSSRARWRHFETVVVAAAQDGDVAGA